MCKLAVTITLFGWLYKLRPPLAIWVLIMTVTLKEKRIIIKSPIIIYSKDNEQVYTKSSAIDQKINNHWH